MTPQRTKVDWLSFRTQAEVPEVVPALKGVFGEVGSVFNVAHRTRGWQGYRSSADLLLADMHVGMLAWGGDNQRDWVHVSLSAQGCDWVRDWDEAQDRLRELPAFDPRRVDLALDAAGREVTHEAVLTAYRSGEFTTQGRPPKCTRIESERPEDGRTVYVGDRKNDKFFRGYEKGKQLAAGSGVRHIGGVPVADMYRLEVELKAKSGELPRDLIDRRDQYFAGCYPYLQRVLCDVDPEILCLDRRVAPRIELERALANIRDQYGRTLFTALTVHQGDIGAVWERICGTEHNAELLRQGVLMVDHEGAL